MIDMRKLHAQGITVVPADHTRVIMRHRDGSEHVFSQMGPKQGTYMDDSGKLQDLNSVIFVVSKVNNRRETYAAPHC